MTTENISITNIDVFCIYCGQTIGTRPVRSVDGGPKIIDGPVAYNQTGTESCTSPVSIEHNGSKHRVNLGNLI